VKLGIIDVREWQTTVDFRTGQKIKEPLVNPLVKSLNELLHYSPYPGDMNLESIVWVTQVALRLDKMYYPDFMFLNYATPCFMSLFNPPAMRDWSKIVDRVFAEVEKFVVSSGFTPIVVGAGSTIPLQGNINLSTLDGLVNCGGMGAVYAGLYEASDDDLDYLNQHKLVEMIVPRDQLIQEWGGDSGFTARLPEYLLVAKRGYIFRGLGSMSRVFHRVNGRDNIIPLMAPAPVDNISQIAPLIKNMLKKKERVALILIEGIGMEDFRFDWTACTNTFSWYTYTCGDEQYLTLNSGLHLPYHQFPPGYRYYEDDSEDKPYPFSGCFHCLPDYVLGADPEIRSAAVGNRSVLTHLASGADISVECLARSLYNYGSMGVIDIGIS